MKRIFVIATALTATLALAGPAAAAPAATGVPEGDSAVARASWTPPFARYFRAARPAMRSLGGFRRQYKEFTRPYAPIRNFHRACRALDYLLTYNPGFRFGRGYYEAQQWCYDTGWL